jgi:hypothetical protein
MSGTATTTPAGRIAPACMWCGGETSLQSAGRALALYTCRSCAAPTVSQERARAWTKDDHQIAAMFHRCAAARRTRGAAFI